MSTHLKRERPGTQPAAHTGSEANGLDSFIHSLSIQVEYYRSFEYRLKWKGPMYPRRSTRLTRAQKRSPQRSPSPYEETVKRRLRGKRQWTGRRRTESGEDVVKTDEGSNSDIISIISITPDAKRVNEEDKGTVIEISDDGLEESDEDTGSGGSSIASGPSILYHSTTTTKTQRPSQDLCSACKMLYQKAKRMKAPIKNKLLENDPKSLMCDQWVLIKKLRPRRLPNVGRKLMIHVQLVKKRLKAKNGEKPSEKYVGASSACKRPHTFLQRNLRRCERVPAKEERRRKRTRDDSPGSRLAKLQRLHNSHRQHIDSSGTNDSSLQPASGHSSGHSRRHSRRHSSGHSSGHSGHSSGHGIESCSDSDINSQADKDVTFESIPSTVTLETTKLREVSPKKTPKKKTQKKTPKKARGFRDLLAQLRGSNSMIVRETR